MPKQLELVPKQQVPKQLVQLQEQQRLSKQLVSMLLELQEQLRQQLELLEQLELVPKLLELELESKELGSRQPSCMQPEQLPTGKRSTMFFS